MKKTLLAIFIVGCATIPTPEGRKEIVRNNIHERHSWCMASSGEYAHQHGVDAFRYVWCDRASIVACREAGLEDMCDQWQKGGL